VHVVGIDDQRIGHAALVQQPASVRIGAQTSSPRTMQTCSRFFGALAGEAATVRGAGSGEVQILDDYADLQGEQQSLLD